MKIATLQVLREDERRSFDRIPVGRISTARGEDARPVDIVVGDFSADGFSFACAEQFEIGDVVRVGLSGAGTADARIVRRVGDGYGCMFLEPLSPQRFTEAFSPQQALNLGTTVLPGPAADEAYPEPHVTKWPRPARAAFIIVVPLSLWAIIGGAVFAMLR